MNNYTVSISYRDTETTQATGLTFKTHEDAVKYAEDKMSENTVVFCGVSDQAIDGLVFNPTWVNGVHRPGSPSFLGREF